MWHVCIQSVNEGSVTNEACFRSAVDINSDGTVDVYDLQLLYEIVSGISTLAK